MNLLKNLIYLKKYKNFEDIASTAITIKTSSTSGLHVRRNGIINSIKTHDIINNILIELCLSVFK